MTYRLDRVAVRRQSRIRMIVAAVGAIAFFAIVLYGQRAWQWWERRLDAPQNVNGVAIAAVHGELFPAWVVAAAAPRGQETEAETYAALREAVAPDGNLLELVERLHEVVGGKDLVGDAERVEGLLGQWNGYLDEHEVPFQLSGGIVVTDRPMFYATSLQTLAEMTARVGEHDVRVRVMQRVDRTTIRERYLGAVMPGIDGAVVLTDAVLEFALDRVWPVLDPNVPDELLSPTARPFAAAVRREATNGLRAPTLAVLQDTAAIRGAAVNAQREVERRSGCSHFVLHRLGPTGVSLRDLGVLRANIDSHAECPPVTQPEYDAVREASLTLSKTDGLQAAVEELLAWSTRSIVIHEARHVADVAVHGDSIVCTTCPEGTAAEVLAEVSAYAAAFSWSKTPFAALYQACDAVSESLGIHRRAMEIVLESTSTSCSKPPDNPNQVMRQFEAAAFSREEPITVPDPMPSRLSLPPRSVPPQSE